MFLTHMNAVLHQSLLVLFSSTLLISNY